MRQIWRFLRVLGATVVHMLYLSVTVRRLPGPEQARYRARRQQVGCRLLCEMLGVQVEVQGTFPEGRALLAVCNHFGVLDPLVLASQLPVAFVGMAEMRRWPLVGWVTREMGVIFVERERRTQAAPFVEAVRARMREGVCVLVFPEGTTTRETKVQPFKTGAFAAVAGMEEGAVLPLYLHAVEVEGRPAVGAVRERVIWAGSTQSFLGHFWQLMGLRSVRMQIRIGEPVPTAAHDRKELAGLTHRQVSALGAGAGSSMPACRRMQEEG